MTAAILAKVARFCQLFWNFFEFCSKSEICLLGWLLPDHDVRWRKLRDFIIFQVFLFETEALRALAQGESSISYTHCSLWQREPISWSPTFFQNQHCNHTNRCVHADSRLRYQDSQKGRTLKTGWVIRELSSSNRIRSIRFYSFHSSR